jgi:tetratricopeptide (TPR) repeat protein
MESEAPPSAGWYHFLGWLDVNRKRVIMGAVIVAVIAAAIATAIWYQRQRREEAARAVSSVRLPFDPLQVPDVKIAEEYLKVAKQYDGTAASGHALLKAASIYFANGQFSQAQAQFQRFLKDHGEDDLVPSAQFGVAACLDAQGKSADAIQRYNDFTRAFPNDPAIDEARLALARLYEKSNQPQQAVEILNRMTNAPPFSPIGGEVQDRLKAIYAKNPNLAPVAAPRTPPTTPPISVTPRTNCNGSATNSGADRRCTANQITSAHCNERALQVAAFMGKTGEPKRRPRLSWASLPAASRSRPSIAAFAGSWRGSFALARLFG